MKEVLRFIKEGTVTPTALRQRVAVFFKEKYPNSQNSEKFVNTMLVGLMGRLVEMRLVEIEKDAQKSKYSATKSGEQSITRNENMSSERETEGKAFREWFETQKIYNSYITMERALNITKDYLTKLRMENEEPLTLN